MKKKDDSYKRERVDPKTLILYDGNPRQIKDANFEKLKKSIQEFPEMLNLRPLVIDEKNQVLGGNMRLRVALDLGLETVPVICAIGLTESQKKEFIIKDNVSFGEWDFDILANQWDDLPLGDWCLDVPTFSVIEDDADSFGEPSSAGESTKFLMIELTESDYDMAVDILKGISADFSEAFLEILNDRRS